MKQSQDTAVMRVRTAETEDIDEIMQIWLEGNIGAHSFIPADYWEKNFSAVKSALPQAEVYVCVCKGEIIGFMGLNGNHIEGIFVKPSRRRQGAGRALLEKAKEIKQTLTLNVYAKNVNAVNFYLGNGFTVAEEGADPDTDEPDYLMQWKMI